MIYFNIQIHWRKPTRKGENFIHVCTVESTSGIVQIIKDMRESILEKDHTLVTNVAEHSINDVI